MMKGGSAIILFHALLAICNGPLLVCAAADTWLQYFGPNLPAADWAVKAVFVTEKREIVTSDSAEKFKN